MMTPIEEVEREEGAEDDEEDEEDVHDHSLLILRLPLLPAVMTSHGNIM